MLRFIVRRMLEAVPTLFVIVTIAFFLVRLAPGGPFSSEKNVSPEVLARLNAHYGLDKPLLVQYLDYLGRVLHVDLGPSFKYSNRTVNELIAESFPVSLELGVIAITIAVAFGVTAGVASSLRHNTAVDRAAMTAAMVGICVPTFVLGPLLVLVFSLRLGWFSASGWYTLSDRVLPALTLAAPYAAYIARLSRGGMMEILPQDFIRTACAKGLPPSLIVVRHALRGGLLPVVSFLGPAFAGIITGSFVVETIFQIPGLGRYFVMAAFNRDYTMVAGTVLFYAVLIIAFNLIVDIVIAWLNPKARIFTVETRSF